MKEQGRSDEAERVARQIEEARRDLERRAHEGGNQPKHSLNGELETVREYHAEYYLAMTRAAEPEFAGRWHETWMKRLNEEHGNLRSALYRWLSFAARIRPAATAADVI